MRSRYTIFFAFVTLAACASAPANRPFASDPDGDGLVDGDRCPADTEDLDGFEDSDGCPDSDNDMDGVLDVHDGIASNGFGACMNDPEDLDFFQDDDGCPDPDNDGDGMLDHEDRYADDPHNLVCGIPGSSLLILERVFFEPGSTRIHPKKAEPVLNAVADLLLLNANILLVEVQGHTSRGERNAELLGQKRAAAVVSYLVGRGVSPSRLTAKGFGTDKPTHPNTNAERVRARNVSFRIVDPAPHDGR